MKAFLLIILKIILGAFILLDIYLISDIFGIIDLIGIDVSNLRSLRKENELALALTLYSQIIIVLFYIRAVYVVPIYSLKKEIALFLTGARSEDSLSVSGLNSDANFIINFFNKSLQILRNFKDEMKAGRVLRSEVEIAAEIQRTVLDKKSTQIPSLEYVANSKSATEVGGDSFDIIQRGENYYIYLWDVTGHGVASWFVMMMVNALISGFSLTDVNGAGILAKTNAILKPRVKQNMMMTCLLVRWNEAEKKLYMTGAWHEYLIIYKSNGTIQKIKTGWVALGMVKDISKALREENVQIDIDDIIVLYTDGITEARLNSKQDGLLFGVDRLIDAIDRTQQKTAQNVFNNITIELSKFMGYNHVQYDDITLIVMRYKGTFNTTQTPDQPLQKDYITEWDWNSETVVGH